MWGVLFRALMYGSSAIARGLTQPKIIPTRMPIVSEIEKPNSIICMVDASANGSSPLCTSFMTAETVVAGGGMNSGPAIMLATCQAQMIVASAVVLRNHLLCFTVSFVC